MSSKPTIPTAKEISPTSGLDLDEKCALDHFLGLDQAAALRMFQEEDGGVGAHVPQLQADSARQL